MSETTADTTAATHDGRTTPARRGAAYDSAFLRACRHEPVPHTPVWFMRQAGRSLPEYLKVREGIPMLESCMRPELVKEITLQPVRRHKVDAAIFFSDIVVPLKAVGIDVDIKAGVGPVIAARSAPSRTSSGCARWSRTTSPTSPRPSACWWTSSARPR